MRLINKETKVEIQVENKVFYHKGTAMEKRTSTTVCEIIQPCEQWPDGLVKVGLQKTGDVPSWQQYYPHVFNLEFVE